MQARRQNRWKQAVVLSGAALALAALAVGVNARDAESAAMGALFAVATALVGRGLHRVGSFVLAALCLNLLFWLVPATYSNVAHDGELGAVGVPAVLVAVAILALGSLVGWAADMDERSVLGLVALLVLAVAAVIVVPRVSDVGTSDRAERGDLRLSARTTAFSTDELDASAGTIGVVLENHDLFWHTFTVRQLDVEIRVPVRGSRRVSFAAPPGTYQFVCSIPGHEAAGMKGKLVVR
jgi:plastocyanin